MYTAYICLFWCVILHQENLELTRQALRAAKVRIHAYEESLQVEYQKKYFEAFELVKRLLHEKVASLTLSVNNWISCIRCLFWQVYMHVQHINGIVCASHWIDNVISMCIQLYQNTSAISPFVPLCSDLHVHFCCLLLLRINYLNSVGSGSCPFATVCSCRCHWWNRFVCFYYLCTLVHVNMLYEALCCSQYTMQ